MKIIRHLLLLLACSAFYATAQAGSTFTEKNDGVTVGTLYTQFSIDNQSAYHAYLDLDANGTWRPARGIASPDVTPCNCIADSNWDSASQILRIGTITLAGFDYAVDIEISTNQTWRLISLAEHPFDLNGRWSSSYNGYQVSYTVVHNGNQVAITSSQGTRSTGTINGKTAVLRHSSSLITSASRAVLTTKNSVTLTVLSCIVPSGYVCVPGVGVSIVVNRQ